MGIDLRRRYIGMAEQFLHHPQISAIMQKMACEGMTKNMRTDARGGNASRGGAGLEIAGESLAGKMAARAVGGKKPRSSRETRMGFFKHRTVGSNRAPRRAGQWHDPLAFPFATN